MSKLQANICLLVVTILWSSEVIIFSVIPPEVPSWATMCITAIIGAILLWACFAKRILQAIRNDKHTIVRRMALLSVLNLSYNALIIMSLRYFNATTSAFLLTMTMVALPFLLLALRREVPSHTWITAGLVLVGVIVAVAPGYIASQTPGVFMMLGSCTLRALYITKLNDFAREHDPIALSTGMVSFNAIFGFVPWFIVQPETFAAIPWTPPVIASLFIYAYFVVAFVSVINTFAQRRATASEATIIFASEIVFTVLWATILPPEIVEPTPLTLTTVLGCGFIVMGNIVEIFRPASGKKAVSAKPEQTAEEAPTKKAEASDTPPDPQPAPTADVISTGLARLHSPVGRKVTLFVVLVVVYLVIAMPFKVLVLIPGFTELRPVSMLQPVYGIFFGIPGCLAFAAGNLIVDIATDSLRLSSIAGFVGSFVYPYLMYLFWTQLRKQEFNLRTGRTLALFCFSVVVCACIQSLIITAAVAFYYPDVDYVFFATVILVNGIAFPICLAVPFIALIQDELGFKPVSKSRRRDSRRAASSS